MLQDRVCYLEPDLVKNSRFAAVAVTHVVRLATAIEIVVGGVVAPVWVSFPGALIATLLAVWMAVAARR